MSCCAGHYETVPYDEKTIRSVYHVREYDIARLLQVSFNSLPTLR
jgi:lariat debranching enzyme